MNKCFHITFISRVQFAMYQNLVSIFTEHPVRPYLIEKHWYDNKSYIIMVRDIILKIFHIFCFITMF